MFSETVFCLTFLVWGCIAQANQTSSIQGHDEDNNGDTMVRAININDGALLETEINPLLLGVFIKSIPPPLQLIETTTAGIKTKRSLYSKNDPIVEDTLKAHNEYRKLHGVPPLKLDDEMNKEATIVAENYAKTKRFVPPSNPNYGVNIYHGGYACPFFKNRYATDEWYEDIKDFTFGVEPKDGKGTSFAQVVWKSTKLLGVGYAKVDKYIHIVAVYSPRGNQLGQYLENVPPPLQPIDAAKADTKTSRALYSKNEPIVEDTLKAHNKYRKLHGVPPLKLDDEMNKEATIWAENLAKAGRLVISSNRNYGVNAFQGDEKCPYFKNSQATDLWYEGIKDFTFGVEPKDGKGTSFAQVVWRSTNLLGVGIGRKDRYIYVVALYSPRGNQLGQYLENVPPPLQPSDAATADTKTSRALYSKNDPIVEDTLKAHNEYRKLHGVPPLKLDDEMNKEATIVAENYAKTKRFVPPSNPNYGVNIYHGGYACPFFKNRYATDEWYEDIKDFTFGVEPKDGKGTSFAQVVWKSTKLLGVGYAKVDKYIHIVAVYSPRGNQLGQYLENVPPPLQPSDAATADTKTSRALYSKNDPIVEDTLKAHNEYRKLHGVPPLKLDDEMNKEATIVAENYAKTKRFVPPSNPNYGVNIYHGGYACPFFKNRYATDEWYEDIKDFTFGVEPKDGKGTSFAQVVWKSTKLLGVGYAKVDKYIHIVAVYSPRGNQLGQYLENVPPPLQPSDAATADTKTSRALYSKNDPIVEDTLKAHNEYRKLHGVPPLKLDDEMNKEATIVAENYAKTKRFVPPSNPNYGVNIYHGGYACPFFKNRYATDEWYEDIKDFTFGVEPKDGKGTSFAQVVWKSTKLLGVGYAKVDKYIHIVAVYFPRGNQNGQYKENVPPVQSS